MKNFILTGIGLGLAALGGLWWGKPAPAPAAGARTRAEVFLASAAASLDSALLVTKGWVGAGEEVLLPARTKGRVRNIFFAAGDYARAGQLLVKLDNHTFVTAPRAGFLGPCRLRIGQYLTGKTVVTTLSSHSYLVVSISLPADWQAGIHPGDSARVWSQRPAGRVAVAVVGAMKPPGPGDAPVEVILTSRAPFRIGEQVYVWLQDSRPQVALQ